MRKERYMGDESRVECMVSRFGDQLEDPILDLGCRDKILRHYFDQVVGIDNVKSPYIDFKYDLERVERGYQLPEAKTVVASHILEHLSNKDELVDVIKDGEPKWVLIGLPNELNWMRRMNFLRGQAHGKFTVWPGDRHKWFFTLESAKWWSVEKMAPQYDLFDECAPTFDLKEAQFYTNALQFLVEFFGSESMASRDWWGLFKRKEGF